MRIEKNDHQRENAFICYQILLTNSLKKKIHEDESGELLSEYWSL